MIKFNLPVTARLSLIKSILALSVILTLAVTWPLWTATRYYPLAPGSGTLPALNPYLSWMLPLIMSISLVMVILLRRPRVFIFLALLSGLALLVLDTGRGQYWFCFYLLMLLILFGYNWRVDNINHYSGNLNALRVTLALVYVFAAVQHFQSGFFESGWPSFIKPFERYFTPEQCTYLLKAGYVVPFLELFICAALFVPAARIAAISLAVLFHLFSVVVLFMQPVAEPAVVVWHISLCLLLVVAFGGKVPQQKSYTYSFGLYPTFVILVFGIIMPVYFFAGGKTLQNRIDLMQHNGNPQCIYVTEEAKNQLPLYIQSFALQREKGYCKLNLTSWMLHETRTRQVLSPVLLMQVTSKLTQQYGVEGLVALPPAARQAMALK